MTGQTPEPIAHPLPQSGGSYVVDGGKLLPEPDPASQKPDAKSNQKPAVKAAMKEA